MIESLVPPAPPLECRSPWKRPGWLTNTIQSADYDNSGMGHDVRLFEIGYEHGDSDTLACVYAAPYRTLDEAEELAERIADDPDTLDALAATPGVIDRRPVMEAKYPPRPLWRGRYVYPRGDRADGGFDFGMEVLAAVHPYGRPVVIATIRADPHRDMDEAVRLARAIAGKVGTLDELAESPGVIDLRAAVDCMDN